MKTDRSAGRRRTAPERPQPRDARVGGAAPALVAADAAQRAVPAARRRRRGGRAAAAAGALPARAVPRATRAAARGLGHRLGPVLR